MNKFLFIILITNFLFSQEKLVVDDKYLQTGIDFKEKLINKIGYKPIKMKRGSFRPDTRHSLIWTLAVPLLYQDTSTQATTKEEKQAIKDIETFTSKDYKPVIDGEYKPEDMEMLK